MKRLRLRIMLMVGWLIIFLGSQLVFNPIGMHSIIYTFIGASVILILLVPGLSRYPVWLVGFVSGFAFIALKAVTGELFDGTLAVYTITEVSFVLVTVILSHWVNQAVHEFEAAIAKISIGNNEKISEHVYKGLEILYREVRRARNHQRPLTLLTIGVDEKLVQPALNKVMLEAQSALKKQLVLSSISKILCEKLEDCDIVVQEHDRFLVALPETTPDDLPFLVNRIQKQVTDQVGIDLQVGVASLPVDGFTLEGLIEKSAHNMNVNHAERIYLETETTKINLSSN